MTFLFFLLKTKIAHSSTRRHPILFYLMEDRYFFYYNSWLDNDPLYPPSNRCKLLGRLCILRANCFKADKAAKKREKEVFDYTQNVLITFNIIWLCEWLSEPSAGTHCLFSLLAPVHKSRSAPPKCHLVAR